MTAWLDAVFPPACAACAKLHWLDFAFCPSCALELERVPQAHCSRCAEPGDHDGNLCPGCRARPPAFSRAYAPWVHAGPMARAVHRFKYEDHPELARPLARFCVEEGGQALFQSVDAVLAIPLHPSRRAKRLFDQAQLLAAELARVLSLPWLRSSLRRTRATARQVGLSERARVENLAGAFEAGTDVAGRRVLLVDDVFTTGATARAAAEAVLAAGAPRAEVLTLARAYSGM